MQYPILAFVLAFMLAQSVSAQGEGAFEESGEARALSAAEGVEARRQSALAQSLRGNASVFTVRHDYGDISQFEAHANIVYEVNLLTLAMEKSVSEFGPYEIEGVDKGYMTHSRAMELMRSKHIENYVKVLGYNSEEIQRNKLDFADFPVYLGLLSYRTCFTSKSQRKKLSRINSLGEFTSLIQATGVGWVDTAILSANNIEVREIPNVRAIYEMVARKRIDVFCRGANEALSDYEENKSIKGLMYDRSLAMYYPNPHFFHVNKDNKLLRDRLTLGLEKAYHDGSLQELWSQVFGDSVAFVGGQGRKVFELRNPLVDDIPVEFQSYEFYRPSTKPTVSKVN